MMKVDELRDVLMNEAHNTKYLIPPDTDKMYQGLKRIFWWPGMKDDVARYVSNCMTYTMVKVKHQKPSGLSKQPGIPERKWGDVTTDLVTKLPKTKKGNDDI